MGLRSFSHGRYTKLGLVVLLALGLSWRLVSSGSDLPATSSPGAAADETEVLAANHVVALRKQLGHEVTVRGHIASTGQSPSGHQFLNFASSELTAVCYPEHVDRFTSGKPADLYRDKDLQLRGKVELYKGKLQIRLRDPDQIRVLSGRPQSGVEGVTLKQIGKTTWRSPAGLLYRGNDPEGRTRVEHIERHTRDEPSRAGPHGVFDGGSRVAFAVIDEAWETAQRRKLRPQVERDRSSFTVSLGRRIGFMGGRLGAARDHPSLNRVFIVFKTGTQEIITAFPK